MFRRKKIELNKDAYDFCKNCLIIDQVERPSAHELIKHPYVAKAELDTAFLTSLRTIFITLSMHRSGF